MSSPVSAASKKVVVSICQRLKHPKNMSPKGLFALQKFKPGDVVHTLHGAVSTTPSSESIHIGSGLHITDDYGKYVNHSFAPTVCVKRHSLVAIKYIVPGDEITFNYNSTEENMAAPFVDYATGLTVGGNSDLTTLKLKPALQGFRMSPPENDTY